MGSPDVTSKFLAYKVITVTLAEISLYSKSSEQQAGFIAKAAVEIAAECQEDFCCGYVAEAKAPESCWFP